MTKEELLNILYNPFEQEQPWMIQGLGMLQLKLDNTRTKRLHIWDHRYEIPDHTEVHNHPWDFTSVILAGELTNTIYRIVKPSDEWPNNYRKINIKCGPLECVPSEPEDIAIDIDSVSTYFPGESYAMEKEWLHSTKNKPGTITLIERTGHDPENQADIFYPINGSWVSAEFRKATNEEVLDIINEALKYAGA